MYTPNYQPPVTWWMASTRSVNANFVSPSCRESVSPPIMSATLAPRPGEQRKITRRPSTAVVPRLTLGRQPQPHPAQHPPLLQRLLPIAYEAGQTPAAYLSVVGRYRPISSDLMVNPLVVHETRYLLEWNRPSQGPLSILHQLSDKNRQMTAPSPQQS